MSCLFNSYDPYFKQPFGAVRAGQTVHLTLCIPEELGYVDPHLVLQKEGKYDVPVHYRMKFDGQTPHQNHFSVDVVLGDPGLYFYYFDLYTDFRRIVRGADNCGVVSWQEGESWQITVYEPDFQTPECIKGKVFYQIFPDRFCEGIENKPMPFPDRLYQADKHAEPFWQPNETGGHLNEDYFGGDLEGIRIKLPYLREMGVDYLYLNPIFEAHSNHRYNTADYCAIDPMLGTEADFRQLCQRAKALGLRVILDGVFNHTGSQSRYFNADGFYPDTGAAQSQTSPYFDWFSFHPWPTDYDAWWGIKTLPAVREDCPSYRNFIIHDENAVARRWLRAGASGWRLDVADELPDDVLRGMRSAAKETDPDSVLLGEVWEDAVTKVSYGERRQYTLGDALDSVMNYPLRDGLVTFLTGRSTARALADLLLSQRLNYPRPLYYALMNLTASHDVARTRSALALDFDPRSRTRAELAALEITDAMAARGAQLQVLAAAVQFWLPGIPSIYYGDETGMQGLCDPFNRAPLQMCDTQMLQWYAQLTALRHAHPALTRGEVAVFAPAGDVLCVLRVIADGRDAFGEEAEDEALLLTVNRAAHPVRCHVELTCPGAGLCEETRLAFVRSEYDCAADCTDDTHIAIHDGVGAFDLPPHAAKIYRLENRHGTETGS